MVYFKDGYIAGNCPEQDSLCKKSGTGAVVTASDFNINRAAL